MNELDRAFMKQIYLVTAILTGVGFIFAWVFFSVGIAFGLLGGGIFSIINNMILGELIRAYVRPEKRNILVVLNLAFLKFPILLGLLFVVLMTGRLDPVGFLVGFPLIFIAMIICRLSAQNQPARNRADSGGEVS
ncbi:MAG: ATP synthase subunit I [bacterium]